MNASAVNVLRLIGTARGSPRLSGKSGIEGVYFFHAGYLKKFNAAQALNHALGLINGVAQWTSPTLLLR